MRDLQSELETSQHARTQLERATLQMADEIRRLKSQVDTHGTELANLSSEFRSRARKLEDDTRLQVRVVSVPILLFIILYRISTLLYRVQFEHIALAF